MMQVDFERPAGISEPDFECFGNTIENPPFQVTETLANLGYDNDTSDPSIDNCFQQAGDYTVTITLIDNAGNTTSEEALYFQMAPSDPDVGKSNVGPANCTGIVADGSTSCNLYIDLKDRFQNPVTQINQAEFYSGTGEFEDDANDETRFRSGLRIQDSLADNIPVPDGANPITITDNNTPDDGRVHFSLKAVAPSIAKAGLHLAKRIARVLTFSATVEIIGEDGDPTGIPSIEIASPLTVQFDPPFSLRPEGTSFVWNAEEGAQGDIVLTLGGLDIGEVDNLAGMLLSQNPEFEYLNEPLPEDPFGIEERIINHSTTVRPAGFNDGVVINDNTSLALTTEIEYQIGELSVKYPAGGVGMANFNGPGGDPSEHDDVIGYNVAPLNFEVVGADIEGGIVGDEGQMVIQAVTGNDNTFQLGRANTDFRQIILENTARLSRGAENIYDENDSYDFSEFELDFDESDTVIVEFENAGTITISADTTLPEGRNTLIIKNGNLVIDGDVWYDDERPEDSFGFILVNDNQEVIPPATGNIFIRPDVRNLVGTFYADGGLMTNDSLEPTIANGPPLEDLNTGHTIQLLLTGTLFTKNTLGGSLIVNDGNFFTPWGTTDNQFEARKYDLHYIRRYIEDLNPDDGQNGDNLAFCAPIAGNCDENKNAFVIRIDRKASLFTPPGFGDQGTIR